MLNKSFNPYIKIMNLPAFRLGYCHGTAMNLIGMLLLVPRNLSEKLMLLPTNTFYFLPFLFSLPSKSLFYCIRCFFILPQYPPMV